jgi:hypothetical protein
MATTGTQSTTEQAKPLVTEKGERVFPMSREGKRQAYILLAGVASIWIFALWTLITILQDGVSGVEWVSMLLMIGMIVVAPVVAWTLLEEASAHVETGEQGIRYRSMGGIDLRYNWGEVEGPRPKGRNKVARFFLGDDDDRPEGTVNINNNKKESNVEAGEFRREVIKNNQAGQSTIDATAGRDEVDSEEEVDEDGEPETILLSVPDKSGQIANPISRFLHRQAHGPTLPIYGNLESRGDLLGEISRRVSLLPHSTTDNSPQPQVEVPPKA